MFEFLKSKRPVNQVGGAPVSVSPVSTSHHSDVRRELIRVVLKDTLRQHGIPLDWLSCEVISIRRGVDQEELHIQLVLMKWHEHLLRYAAALQQQLLRGLDRFDPEIDHSKYVVSWRFAPDCGNPFVQMPEAKFWLAATPAKAPEPLVSVLDRRLAPRPVKGLAVKPAPAPAPTPQKTAAAKSSYQPTQIAPL